MTQVPQHVIQLAVLYLCLHSFIAAPAPTALLPEQTWLIEELAKVDAPVVHLTVHNTTVTTIERKQVLYLYAVMQSIIEASETPAQLLIHQRTKDKSDSPNAFAGYRRFPRWLPDPPTPKDADALQLKRGESVAPARINLFDAPNDKNNTVILPIVGLNLAMLDMLGNDVHMAAALIGHELAHLKLNHGRKRGAKGSNVTFEANRFSRDNEREADYLGAVWAHEAGYDLAGAIRLEEALYSLQKRRQGYSITHPMGIERTVKIKSLARRLGRKAHHNKPD